MNSLHEAWKERTSKYYEHQRRIETSLDAMRDLLTLARESERAEEFEQAEAFGARAANKLSVAVFLQRKVLPFSRS